MLRRLLVTSITIALLGHDIVAQSDSNQYPEIGRPIPNFVVKNISDSLKKDMTYKDFQGKFLILDFWNKNCIVCVKNFPKTNELYQRFIDKVTIMVVGTEEDGIQPMFQKFKASMNLKFPTAFDYNLYNQFVHGGTPHLIWIDRDGIVRAITTSLDLNGGNIESFINGEKFDFIDRSYQSVMRDVSSLDSILTNKGYDNDADLLYKSELMKYDPDKMEIRGLNQRSIDRAIATGQKLGRRVKIEGMSDLEGFYKMAYTGYCFWNTSEPVNEEYYNRLLFELNDSSEFLPNPKTGENIYWYRLIVPQKKVSREYLMQKMQRDFGDYFGYSVNIESRLMPYWKLTATEEVKKQLKTKGGSRFFKGDHSGFKARNVNIDVIISAALRAHKYDIPFIDETGMNDNIDIEFDAILTDFESVKKTLHENGFNLTKAVKEFKVIVVSDKSCEYIKK